MFFWYQINFSNPFYPLNNANSVYMIFHVEKTFNAMICQICGKYTKTKSEIIKHKKINLIFFWIWFVDFEISNLCQKSQDQHQLKVFLDEPKAPIKNVISQPFGFILNIFHQIGPWAALV